MPTTLNLEECAELLKVTPSTAGDLACRGILPGAKIGRAWVFLEADVLNYLREQVKTQTARRSQAMEPLGIFIAPAGRRRKPLPRLPEMPPGFDPKTLKND